ncbi:MAG: class I SAM-dependent methyltransferase [Chloroflexaceae bacterium]|nr:class I SAM-dependent methyltransferase [Chloroflexaceae bacterium]
MKHTPAATGERVIATDIESRDAYLMYLRHLVAYTFAHRQIGLQSNVLDLGCGAGYGTSMLSFRARSIIGLDVNRESIRHATQTYQLAHGCFSLYDGCELPLASASLDVVVSFQVIEHVLDDRLFVAEAYRVLRPGGLLLVSTPDRTHRLKPGQRPWNRFHIREYHSNGLKHVLHQSFAHVQIASICANDAVYAYELERVRWAQRVAMLDVLRLREAVPEGLLPLIGGWVKRLSGRAAQQQRTADLEQDDDATSYRVVMSDAANRLDLLALCRKAAT